MNASSRDDGWDSRALNPVEIKNNLVFHNLRKPDTLAKFLARGDEFFEVMYAMYKTNN